MIDFVSIPDPSVSYSNLNVVKPLLVNKDKPATFYANCHYYLNRVKSVQKTLTINKLDIKSQKQRQNL